MSASLHPSSLPYSRIRHRIQQGDTVNHIADFTGTSSVTVTVTTTANTAAAGVSSADSTGIAGSIALGILLFLVRRHEKQLRLALLGLLVVAIGAWPACGGGSSGGGGGGGGGSNGTTSGNYTVTVNAYTVSSSDAASPSATTNFSLTVN